MNRLCKTGEHKLFLRLKGEAASVFVSAKYTSAVFMTGFEGTWFPWLLVSMQYKAERTLSVVEGFRECSYQNKAIIMILCVSSLGRPPVQFPETFRISATPVRKPLKAPPFGPVTRALTNDCKSSGAVGGFLKAVFSHCTAAALIMDLRGPLISHHTAAKSSIPAAHTCCLPYTPGQEMFRACVHTHTHTKCIGCG